MQNEAINKTLHEQKLDRNVTDYLSKLYKKYPHNYREKRKFIKSLNDLNFKYKLGLTIEKNKKRFRSKKQKESNNVII